jgi:hypothetical protein
MDKIAMRALIRPGNQMMQAFDKKKASEMSVISTFPTPSEQ